MGMLEAALKKLFDYQRFESDPDLQAVIDDTQRRYPGSRPLSLEDDELALAAGGLTLTDRTQEPGYDGRGTI